MGFRCGVWRDRRKRSGFGCINGDFGNNSIDFLDDVCYDGSKP